MKEVNKSFEVSFRKERGTETAERRPSFSLNYSGFEGENEQEVIQAEALNSTIENFARALIQAKAKDWNYRPEASELNLANWYRWYTSSAPRTRAVTALTLGAFAEVYEELAVKLLNKPIAAAKTGAQIIRNKLVPVLGNPAALAKIESNILELAEAVSGSEEFSAALDPHESVINYLLKVIEESKITVTADAL